jgi:hypothetical protein
MEIKSNRIWAKNSKHVEKISTDIIAITSTADTTTNIDTAAVTNVPDSTAATTATTTVTIATTTTLLLLLLKPFSV